eukprot:TRINITY_DN11156_c0_g1_i1.p1 TRINITY_DN11156_c0_g1~~TRINITY_DN11156_c0_g1_i1.p1  ORF type:complete len:145 (+),score=13.22 TRINITY_DN11156_c0_g1_i1:125-559(+)
MCIRDSHKCESAPKLSKNREQIYEEIMKLLVCASEYPPYGSGIGNVIYNVVVQLRKMGVECTICSPTGPDIQLGNKELIKKFGILGLLYFWYQVSRFFKKKSDYDVIWIQNPLFLTESPFKKKCLATMHYTCLLYTSPSPRDQA